MSGNGDGSAGVVLPDHELPLVDEAEVVVVGAGPAGSVAAATLAERGHDVLLVDQNAFPRDKPCGDGLSRASVETAMRFGLEDVIRSSQHVEGMRVVHDHRRVEEKRYHSRSGRARYGACVSRLRFDEALLRRATGAGARFVIARVDGPIIDDGRVTAVRIGRGAEAGRIAGRYFVAADGATSRLRREIGVRRDPVVSAYGVRQYFETELPLDPVFDLYVPISAGDGGLLGYGWVFPLGERLANVGIGYYRGGSLRVPPIRRALGMFAEELATRQEHRFGELRAVGKPFGSPVGIGFDARACELSNLVFVGDAARTTDPLTGEGIGNAMESADAIANMLVCAARRGTQPRDVGVSLARRFPRICQDVSTLTRAYLRTSERDASDQWGLKESARTWSGAPIVEIVQQLVITEEADPTLRGAPVWMVLADQDPACASALEAVGHEVLDALRTSFPMAVEMLYRAVRVQGGPCIAATALLAARAAGGAPTDAVRKLGASLELVELAVEVASEIVDRSAGRRSKLNNALAVLLTDHVAARSLVVQAGLGAGWVARIARLSQEMARGRALLAERAFDVVARPESHLAALRLARGSIGGLAARGAAELSGADAQAAAALERFGTELGVAMAIADEVVDLLVVDDVLERDAGDALRWGRYPLAVHYALERDPSLAGVLGGPLDGDALREAVAAVREAGALDRALAACRERSEAAREALRSGPGVAPDGLDALAAFPPARAARALEPPTGVPEIVAVA